MQSVQAAAALDVARACLRGRFKRGNMGHSCTKISPHYDACRLAAWRACRSTSSTLSHVQHMLTKASLGEHMQHACTRHVRPCAIRALCRFPQARRP